MKISLQKLLLMAISCVFISSLAFAFEWETYVDETFGFTMKIPKGSKKKEWNKDNWAGIKVSHGEATVWGVAKEGKESKKSIESYGVKVTGIAGKNWELVDEGSGEGFEWFRLVQASDGKHIVFGAYGVGNGSSYLMVLKTTVEAYKQHKDKYDEFYESAGLVN